MRHRLMYLRKADYWRNAGSYLINGVSGLSQSMKARIERGMPGLSGQVKLYDLQV